MKLSLLIGLTGMMLLGYGWLTMPAALSLVELLQSEQAIQNAYYQDVNRATYSQLGGCVLVGIGFVSFVILRSRKIHGKKPK